MGRISVQASLQNGAGEESLIKCSKHWRNSNKNSVHVPARQMKAKVFTKSEDRRQELVHSTL